MCSQNSMKLERLELSKLTQDKCRTVSLWVSQLRRCQRAQRGREGVIVEEKRKIWSTLISASSNYGYTVKTQAEATVKCSCFFRTGFHFIHMVERLSSSSTKTNLKVAGEDSNWTWIQAWMKNQAEVNVSLSTLALAPQSRLTLLDCCQYTLTPAPWISQHTDLLSDPKLWCGPRASRDDMWVTVVYGGAGNVITLLRE